MTQRWPVLAALVALPLVLSGVLLRGAQPVTAGPPTSPAHISREDATRLATEARAKLKVEVAPGLDLSLWAPDALIVDPVAMDIDPDGTTYVTSTSRNNMPLDIRAHQDWMAVAHTLKSVEDLRAFYRKEMAPARSDQNRWITDLNKDGSRDIHDLVEYKERLYRIRDTDGDGRADESRVVYEGFNDDPAFDILGGVLSLGGDVIVGVPPGVYRLHDSNGDGVFDKRTTIREGFNTHPAFGGHGVSGVTMGPDGRLYWEVGDIGLHVADKSGRTWTYPNQGAVLRSEVDGSNFEVFATGLRNLQEFSFDERGNLISVDNDGDHQGESERLVYLPYGSDSGWRSNWQYGKYTDPKNNRYNVWMQEAMYKPRHDGQTSHILPPVASWHAGPSGMVYDPGTALSDEWRNHFFVTSFPGAAPNARIYAFTLDPDGAGFRMGSEKVALRGVLAVGMKIGPDGALYLTDWITGWDSKNNGRLWKLDTPSTAGSAVRREVQALLAGDFAARSSAAVAPLLHHADMRIRQKAQFDLVRRGDVQALLFAARDTSNLLARLHGLWGVAQLARRDPQHASQLTAFLTDGDAEVRAQAARMIGDVRHAAGDQLLPLLEDTAPRARYFAAEAVARLAFAPAFKGLVEMLAANDGDDVYLQHAGSLALASINDGAALEALATHDSRAVRTAAVMALRRMRHAGVARFLADADASVATDAARAINDEGGIAPAVPQLAATLGAAPVDNEAFVRRAMNANLRVGTADAAERVAAYAADAAKPADLRVEAVAILGVWTSPSPMDRVDGFYHPSVSVPAPAQAPAAKRDAPRDGTAARAAVQRLLEEAAASSTPDNAELEVALAEAAGRLDLDAAAPTLLAQLKGHPSVLVRVASLRALQALKVGDMSALMQIALADEDPVVRRAALTLLPTLPISPAAKAQHLASIMREGGQVEQQGALEVLGGMKTAESRRLLNTYLDELTAGTLAGELQIDLLAAVQTDGSPALQRKLEAYQRAQQADTLIQAFRAAALQGGDARRGQQVLLQNPLAECTRCHAIRGRGEDVGPELTRIGAILTREQILDSLIEPNKRIAPGYGTVGITLKDGTRVDGTLREETDTEVVVLTGTPAEPQRIPKSEIAERTDPVSAMPPLGLVLPPRDVRDLVEFLSALR